MSVILRNLKGTSDFMPQEQRLRQEIIRKLQDVFECYGYQPLETPIVCCYDVLASKYAGGDEILKEVYKLRDQGNRELGLRYDLTVPFARIVGMTSDIRLPFKRYEIGKVFRDGPVKTGRNREFIQCDVDSAGISSVMAEAELMIMAAEVYAMLGLDVYISFNNRKLLSGLISASGIAAENAGSVILTIDKLEKIGLEATRLELSDKGICKESVDKLFYFMSLPQEAFMQFFRTNPINNLIKEGIMEIDELLGYLSESGILDIIRFTPCLARGLEIYTGTVYEVFLKDGSITSSVGAGGRYDKIIGAFLNNGMEYPAVGMTFGLDVIFEALSVKNNIDPSPPVDVFIIPIGTEKEALSIAVALRKSGVKTDMEMGGRKLRKSLDYANKLGIPYVLILGEDELKNNSVKFRDMKAGTERTVMLNDLKPELFSNSL